ncbi:MAG: hypothetical protein IPI76_08250 [Chloracidobacterium sp.]|nr:hypothetical protein [Chloracidobacterium sp.]
MDNAEKPHPLRQVVLTWAGDAMRRGWNRRGVRIMQKDPTRYGRWY